MDLSVQKMQPPATVRGKTAAKRTTPGSESEEAVENAMRDQHVEFKHGNTGYEAIDPDEEKASHKDKDERQGRRKNRELLSQDDLSELTASMDERQQEEKLADGLAQLRAYQAAPSTGKKDDNLPHFEVNI
ncbi:hypothetical protein [uncultured Cohaesibacter sp.]|uniref:hypothetical protein n=1 Tax=uncultured Cohaesibacter sp. TaxID=1002546 RepID=UPI0029C9033B|nr:hypothetical protein [uncultured Cohaesibacter sp.]